MTIKELAANLLLNDRTGDYNRPISINEADMFIGWMDQDDLPDGITPEAFMEAWNELIEEE